MYEIQARELRTNERMHMPLLCLCVFAHPKVDGVGLGINAKAKPAGAVVFDGVEDHVKRMVDDATFMTVALEKFGV